MDHSLCECGLRLWLFCVLNAFRHQRMDHLYPSVQGGQPYECSTPFGINEWITTGIAAGNEGERRCSTPFGINEWITLRENARHHSPGHVLNAFRHQRMDHAVFSAGVAHANQCSTPFGINEWITVRPLIAASDSSRAQRLSASTNGSPSSEGVYNALDFECSTPFGINEWIT